MTAPAWLTERPIAHRGLHNRGAGTLENTLSAADAAIAQRFPIECDVQDTSDGEAVVFHDHTLDRLTTERGAVHEHRADALARLSVGGSSDLIPTLSALLERVAGRVGLVVEIKSRFDGAMGLTRRTCELLLAYPGPVALKSFDPRVVAEVRRIAPALPRGFLGQANYDHPDWAAIDARETFALANLLHLDDMQPDFLSWRVADLPHAAPFLWRRLGGGPVTAWTVRTAEDRRRAAEHADQMVFEGFVPGA